MIVLKILGFLLLAVLLITAIILILPVKLIVCTDENGKIQLKFKLLFFTFGNNRNEDGSFSKELKKVLGLSKGDSPKSVKDTVKREGVSGTVSRVADIIKLFVGRVIWLIKRCTVTKLSITSISADKDAASAAMDYGLACAVIYPLVSFVESSLKVKKNAVNLDLRCDFEAQMPIFALDIQISVLIFNLVRVFLYIMIRLLKAKSLKSREKKNGKQ